MADTATWTLAEAAQLLTPPMTPEQLRRVVHALAWQPAAHRRLGKTGRPAPAYPISDLQRLHAALTPWLAARPREGCER